MIGDLTKQKSDVCVCAGNEYDSQVKLHQAMIRRQELLDKIRVGDSRLLMAVCAVILVSAKNLSSVCTHKCIFICLQHNIFFLTSLCVRCVCLHMSFVFVCVMLHFIIQL